MLNYVACKCKSLFRIEGVYSFNQRQISALHEIIKINKRVLLND